MSGNSNSGCNVYIGNLDEKVSERVLYDILIQAGRVVDLYIPRDKETDKPKGFAFVEYESEEIADYAIKLFSGIVTLYNRTLRFALSGQDKNTQNSSMTTTPLSSRKSRSDPVPVPVNGMEISHHSMRISGTRHYSSEGDVFLPFSSVQCFDCICFCALLRNLLFDSEPLPPGVTHESNGYETHLNVTNYDYSRRVFGATLDSISRSRSGRYNTSNRHY
ncbi:RRM domain-containing protein [Citrus sinensis]|uniref:RRM domain-containing protein n=1 Tax=Citrus sinensis TaxID=2711 RepID=A0ACB8M861_CITSI|nr:RRM domain-containing protein [Citrus sinensis]